MVEDLKPDKDKPAKQLEAGGPSGGSADWGDVFDKGKPEKQQPNPVKDNLKQLGDAWGQTWNKGVDSFTGNDVEKNFVAHVDDETALSYKRGKQLSEKGNGGKEFSSQEKKDLETYKTIDQKLVNQIPFYDHDAFRKQVDQGIMAKADKVEKYQEVERKSFDKPPPVNKIDLFEGQKTLEKQPVPMKEKDASGFEKKFSGAEFTNKKLDDIPEKLPPGKLALNASDKPTKPDQSVFDDRKNDQLYRREGHAELTRNADTRSGEFAFKEGNKPLPVSDDRPVQRAAQQDGQSRPVSPVVPEEKPLPQRGDEPKSERRGGGAPDTPQRTEPVAQRGSQPERGAADDRGGAKVQAENRQPGDTRQPAGRAQDGTQAAGAQAQKGDERGKTARAQEGERDPVKPQQGASHTDFVSRKEGRPETSGLSNVARAAEAASKQVGGESKKAPSVTDKSGTAGGAVVDRSDGRFSSRLVANQGDAGTISQRRSRDSDVVAPAKAAQAGQADKSGGAAEARPTPPAIKGERTNLTNKPDAPPVKLSDARPVAQSMQDARVAGGRTQSDAQALPPFREAGKPQGGDSGRAVTGDAGRQQAAQGGRSPGSDAVRPNAGDAQRLPVADAGRAPASDAGRTAAFDGRAPVIDGRVAGSTPRGDAPGRIPATAAGSDATAAARLEPRSFTASAHIADKRYILGTEIALAAVIAAGGVARVRADREAANPAAGPADNPVTKAQPGSQPMPATDRSTAAAQSAQASDASRATHGARGPGTVPVSAIDSSLTAAGREPAGTRRPGEGDFVGGPKQGTDKRYITGTEIALAAVLAAAGVRRVAADFGRGGEKSPLVHELAIQAPEIIATRRAEVPHTMAMPQRGDAQQPEAPAAASDTGFGGRSGSLADATQSMLDAVSEEFRPSQDDQAQRTLFKRPTVLISTSDTLVSIAEAFFHDANLGWLIADLNKDCLKESFMDGKRIIEVRSRQQIALPVWQDIVDFYQSAPQDANPENLVTIVEETALNSELLDAMLGNVMGAGGAADPLAGDKDKSKEADVKKFRKRFI